MIALLEGEVVEKLGDRVVLAVGGVGYEVLVSVPTLAKLPPVGRAVRVFTRLHVREDAMVLFGFITTEERQMFDLLNGVSGIGPKLALAFLSVHTPDGLRRAVAQGDVVALATVPGRHVLVEGHTDSTGADEYNLKLSRLRAEAVRSILIAGGVAANRIESQGYGKTRPVASNATATGKAQNRRVEIVVQGAVIAPAR